MMNARVIFTKEFLEKTKGNTMSKSKYKANLNQCKIYFERLADLDSTGELSKYNTRSEVAKAVGFTNNRKGYTWVCNAIKRGRIKEVLIDTYGGKNFYEYHYGRDAQERGKYIRRPKAVSLGVQEAVKEFPKLVKPVDQQTAATAKLSVKYGNAEITFTDSVPVEYVVALVKQLNKE